MAVKSNEIINSIKFLAFDMMDNVEVILIDECEQKNNSESVDEEIYEPVFDEIL